MTDLVFLYLTILNISQFQDGESSASSGTEEEVEELEDPLQRKYRYLLGSVHKDDEDDSLYQVSRIGYWKYDGENHVVAFRKRYDGTPAFIHEL